MTPFDRILGSALLAREDARIVEALARRFGVTDDLSLLALTLALRAPLHGHVCISLDDPFTGLRDLPDDARVSPSWPGRDVVESRLLAAGLARRAEDDVPCPLVIDDGRLYLARFHADELAVAAFVNARTRDVEPLDETEATRLRALLDTLFASSGLAASEAQKRAVATALLRRFTIITGGPGTGKTTTVVRLLALLASRRPEPLRIALLAPTGKAAARLAESVRTQRDALPESLRALVPTDASTIHRALGASHDGRKFTHDASARLPVDVVVVDEASMVDLPLMARLFAAIPDAARVVLLGDRDQLTSVEAGAVLADLTASQGEPRPLSRAFARALGQLVPVPDARVGERDAPWLGDAVVALETSHRFDPARGIGRLASAIHAGDVPAALDALRTSPEAVLHDHDPRDVLPPLVRARVVAHAASLASQPDDRAALDALDAMRVLCAHRKGLSGVASLNQRTMRWLEDDAKLARRAALYAGLPVMVTRNDPSLGLFNGDIGLLRADGEALRAVFHAETGDALRALAPGRLPPFEPVYAMTVHKSQGSEVDEVVLVLPEAPGSVVTRELLYTAITRARTRVHVIGSEDVVARAIRERVVRATGLAERVGA